MSGTLSIVLPSYKSKERLIKVRDRLDEVFSKAQIPYELVIVDDGSLDGSFEVALGLEKKYPNVKAFELSRNYTAHYALFAGFQMVTGDCISVVADDEQQPYELFVDMYKLWQGGAKIIFPYRAKRGDDPLTSRIFSAMFYKIMSSISDFTYPPMGLDSFFIDREVVEILNHKIHPINTTTVTELLRMGYNPVYVPFTRGKSTASKSRWTFKKKVKLAKDWFFSTSSFPIKFISYAGITVSLFALALIVFYLYIRFFGNPNYWKLDVRGWVSTIILISFFSGLILLSLGIIAEYIYRIYEEVKGRPGYIIKKKDDSTK